MKSTRGATILSIGCIISSIIFSGMLFYTRRATSGSIRVKGLCEREVDATIGIWTINFEARDYDLNKVNEQIKEQTDLLVSFLKEKGFETENISFGVPELNVRVREDQEALLPFPKSKNLQPAARYTLGMKVIVHSSNVQLVYESVQKSYELIQKGVQLTRGSWEGPVQFLFTELNKIKPSMIKEATTNARAAAEKFAEDAKIALGPLCNGEQGTFSIDGTYIPTKKQVRVVTYMTYAIK